MEKDDYKRLNDFKNEEFENIKIEMDYSENCQNINECMLHILNQKAGKK